MESRWCSWTKAIQEEAPGVCCQGVKGKNTGCTLTPNVKKVVNVKQVYSHASCSNAVLKAKC